MKFFTRLMVIAALLTMAVNVRANDYLEVQDNYSVYATGRDAIHFKVPIWAYGKVNNYYLADLSYVYFKEVGSDKIWFAVYFKADQKGESGNK